MADAILEFQGIVAGYGGNDVLNGLDLAIPAGRVTTIIGANGAGKSTVFKTLFGLARVKAGRILFAGSDVTGMAPRRLLSLGMVYVPQGRNLFPTLSVRHNLELGGITLPDRALVARRMEAVLARFPRLAERADSQAGSLSGGEQKMLEVGRALLLDPKLLLIDEPSIGLAPKIVAEVFALLVDLASTGVTVLMVEQNVKAGLAVSHHAVALEQGRLALAGPAADMAANPRIGALFLGGHVAAAPG